MAARCLKVTILRVADHSDANTVTRLRVRSCCKVNAVLAIRNYLLADTLRRKFVQEFQQKCHRCVWVVFLRPLYLRAVPWQDASGPVPSGSLR